MIKKIRLPLFLILAFLVSTVIGFSNTGNTMVDSESAIKVGPTFIGGYQAPKRKKCIIHKKGGTYKLTDRTYRRCAKR